MAKGQLHLTPKGPKPCHADPSKPGGRACRYSSDGHFENMPAAEEAYAAKLGGAIPETQTKAAKPVSLVRLPESSYKEHEIRVMREYRNGANWTINGILRRGSMPQGRAGEATATLDTLIENTAPLSSPITVQRSLETGKGSTIKIPGVGEVYSDPAFLSCSTNSQYIEDTIQKGVDEYSDYPSDTILSIEVPKGGKVFALPNEDLDYELEEEVLLPRGAKMEIVKDSGFVNGVRRIQARLIKD